jgi:exopolysaccharide biosynthesis polyprenyl glycosylphosphotransferase
VMDTLRERQSPLVITVPDREGALRSSERGGEDSHLAESRSGQTGADGSSRSQQMQNVSDRFSANYSHPDIACKPVAYYMLKRTFDVVVAIVMLVLAAPIMIAAAVLIKLGSCGPVIFKQVRVGRGGRYFTCYKFRSMCADAEDRKRKLLHLNEVDGPVFKIKNDPRVTPVGAFIRKYSIDELPQLFNVLRGDMSIVGPRPPIPAEVEQYGVRERGRLAVKPGLTCLWQISGRSTVSFERWVELDLMYIDNMSFMNDLGIVVKTIPAVITGSGAH